MKRSTFTIGQYAYCQNCEKTWGDYKNHKARKAAYAHAKKTGHSVTVETTIATTYNQ